MTLLKRLSMLLLALLVLLVGVAFVMPDQAHGERSIVIDRPPSMVFGVLNGFKRFNDWSPWAGLDPNAVMTRSGSAPNLPGRAIRRWARAHRKSNFPNPTSASRVRWILGLWDRQSPRTHWCPKVMERN